MAAHTFPFFSLPVEVQLLILSDIPDKNHLRLVNANMRELVSDTAKSLRLNPDSVTRFPLCKHLTSLPLVRNLQHLILKGHSGISNLPPLPKTLRTLDISSTLIESVANITACTRLGQLIASHAPLTTNGIAAISLCNKLGHLDISHSHVDSLPILPPELLSLCINDTLISDLTSLPTCRFLYELNAASAPIRSISPLSLCTNLHTLVLGANTGLSDLSPLSFCPHLYSIDISESPNLRDLSPLSVCTKLQHLRAFECPGIQDLSPLQTVTNLCELNLSRDEDTGGPGIIDLLPLARLSYLSKLVVDSQVLDNMASLSACRALSDLSCESAWNVQVPACTALTNLNLSYCSISQHSMRVLAQLPCLEDLCMACCPDLLDISPLSKCSSLTSLDIHRVQITDASALTHCPHLYELSANCSAIKVLPASQSLEMCSLDEFTGSDVTPLTHCTALQQLYIHNSSSITDWSPISLLTTLTDLDVSRSSFSNIHLLTTLCNLRLLDINTPDITDVSALAACTSLKRVTIQNEFVTHDSVAVLKAAVPGVVVLTWVDTDVVHV